MLSELKNNCDLTKLDDYVRNFVELYDRDGLFPKHCRACGEEFRNMGEYFCLTNPKGHVMEDCSKVMGRPYTMIYRHCLCGNTLVLVLTEETFPLLNEFWAMMRDLSEEIGCPLDTLVRRFVDLFDREVIKRANCKKL